MNPPDQEKPDQHPVKPEVIHPTWPYPPPIYSLEEFREQLESLQKRQKDAENKKITAMVRSVPGQVYLEYLTFNRELLVEVHSLMTKQYELAKIEEAKEDLAFQILDRAKVAARPSSPKMKLNVAIGFVGGLFLAIFIAFFREYIEKIKAKEAKA